MQFLLSAFQWGLIVGNWRETGIFGQLRATGLGFLIVRAFGLFARLPKAIGNRQEDI